MATRSLRLGTRGSRLALAQAISAKSQLEAVNNGLEIEIVPIKTSGDRGEREVLGAFVREIEQALLEDRIDLALHCLKDLPTEPTSGLTFAAHLERGDPRDAWISNYEGLVSLPSGAVIGTGSPRRTAQLRARRTDLQFKPLVGNVDTRLRKLMEGEYQAIILAIAGFHRLGIAETWNVDHPGTYLTPLSSDQMLPAPGQAVLVLQTREKDSGAIEAASKLDNPLTKECATGEREFLRTFGGGCAVPVAALCVSIDSQLHLRGLVSSPDGSRQLSGSVAGSSGYEIGRKLGAELLAQGAGELFEGVRR